MLAKRTSWRQWQLEYDERKGEMDGREVGSERETMTTQTKSAEYENPRNSSCMAWDRTATIRLAIPYENM